MKMEMKLELRIFLNRFNNILIVLSLSKKKKIYYGMGDLNDSTNNFARIVAVPLRVTFRTVGLQTPVREPVCRPCAC